MAERARHITTTACMENGLLFEHDAVDGNHRMPGDSRDYYWLNVIRVSNMYPGDRLLKNADTKKCESTIVGSVGPFADIQGNHDQFMAAQPELIRGYLA